MQTFLNILVIITFPAKVWLHIYIAKASGRELTVYGVNDVLEVFWFYTKSVTDKFNKLRNICNWLYIVFIVSSIIWVILIRTST
jgi:hypothetical protein